MTLAKGHMSVVFNIFKKNSLLKRLCQFHLNFIYSVLAKEERNYIVRLGHIQIAAMPIYSNSLNKSFFPKRGWSVGAKVLGKIAVPGRPTNLEYSRARAYCACSRCGWGLFGNFFSPLSLLFSFSLSLWETARYRLKYCLKGPLSPKQPTNFSKTTKPIALKLGM